MIDRHRKNTRNRKMIASYRVAHPLCERCLHHHHTTPTEQIHHMIRVEDGGNSEHENLLALCRECHLNIHNETYINQHTYKDS